jgi:hypothetical protein
VEPLAGTGNDATQPPPHARRPVVDLLGRAVRDTGLPPIQSRTVLVPPISSPSRQISTGRVSARLARGA